MEQETIGFIDFFRSVPDHRIERKKLHPVEEILLVTFCAIIAGIAGKTLLHQQFGGESSACVKCHSTALGHRE
jgi:hypothetical protein